MTATVVTMTSSSAALILVAFVSTGCEKDAQSLRTGADELRVVACEGEADAHKILRGKRECLEKGVPFAGCDKEEEIKAEHREALIKCQE